MLPPVTINSDCFVVFVASAVQHNICSNPKWTKGRKYAAMILLLAPLLSPNRFFSVDKGRGAMSWWVWQKCVFIFKWAIQIRRPKGFRWAGNNEWINYGIQWVVRFPGNDLIDNQWWRSDYHGAIYQGVVGNQICFLLRPEKRAMFHSTEIGSGRRKVRWKQFAVAHLPFPPNTAACCPT